MIQDGDTHGDPPYLLEEGWEPLLNGTDLAGWKSCEAGAKNEWYTTRCDPVRAVSWARRN